MMANGVSTINNNQKIIKMKLNGLIKKNNIRNKLVNKKNKLD